jgi:hypothetical protein
LTKEGCGKGFHDTILLASDRVVNPFRLPTIVKKTPQSPAAEALEAPVFTKKA